MGRIRRVIALAASVLVMTAGCAAQVDGVARPDPVKAPLTVTEDGYGIRAGFDDAPVEVEIYTAPGCSHCADLQREYGDDLARFITTGQIAVTYRPLFFHAEDEPSAGPVINAMFAATTPGDGDGPAATGPAFQHFVGELWANTKAGRPAPSPEELAEMARSAGIPEPQAAQIAKGEKTFDVESTAEANTQFLLDLGGDQTPTVYDLFDDEIIDTVYDTEWLSKLTSS